MVATVYTVAGCLFILMFAIVGFCFYARPFSTYDEQAQIALEVEEQKYAKVNILSDA